MGLLGKLFGRSGPAPTSTAEAPHCSHITLTPRWNSVAEMGQEDAVSAYYCEGCSRSFTPAEGRALLQSEADRVQQELHLPT
jgi:hypothetical protein